MTFVVDEVQVFLGRGILRGVIDRDSIEQAAARIASHVRVTPCMEMEPRAFGSAAQLTLKLELMQHTSS